MLSARRGSERRCNGNTYRPLLETLEPRLPPGDTLLGLLFLGGEENSEFRIQSSESWSDSISILGSSSLSPLFGDSSLIVHHSSFGTHRGVEDLAPAAEVVVDSGVLPVQSGGINWYRSNPFVPQPSSATLWNVPLQNTAAVTVPPTMRVTPWVARPESATGVSLPAIPPTPFEDSGRATRDFGSVPFFFEQNMGQADPSFDFVARGSGYTLGLSATEAVMALPIPDNRVSPMELDRLSPEERAKLDPTGRPIAAQSEPRPSGSGAASLADARGSDQIHMQIVGANSAASVAGVNPLVTKINYFIGNDPNQWHTNVPTFAKVQYDEVYPGIDLVYYGQGRDLEYDFVVSPGANPNQIALSFSGADSIELDDEGNLVLHVGDNQIVQNAPYLYQDINGGRKEVAGSFILSTGYSGLVTFDIGDYDATSPLVIDPMVVNYSTYLGGPSSDYAWDVAVDPFGSAYVTGSAYAGFPQVNPAFPYAGGGDAYVSKFSPNGSTLLYSTYLGGTYEDEGDSIAVDGKGAAYLTGYTLSGNFPSTPGAFQPTNADGNCTGNTDCSDAFVVKLAPDGASLLYATYLGGTYAESGEGIAVDASGNAYVMGQTASGNFPLFNPIQNFGGGNCNGVPCFDVSITKLNPVGSSLLYSTYLGGASEEGYFFHDAGDVAVDAAGHAYVTGYTMSWNFPTFNAIQPNKKPEGFNAFVSKLTPDGSWFVYSTYLAGEPQGQKGRAIAADATGNTYAAGFTCADNFPTTPDSYKPTKTGGSLNCDGFITKFVPDGSAFVYSTFFGGSGESDKVISIVADSSGNAYLTGVADSVDFPTKDAFQPTLGGAPDGFVSKLTADGKSLAWSSFLGGATLDAGRGIGLDNARNVYVSGFTKSADFPTVNPFQPEQASSSADAFLTKVSARALKQPLSATPIAP